MLKTILSRLALAFVLVSVLALAALPTPAQARIDDGPPPPLRLRTFVRVNNPTTQPVYLWLHQLDLNRYYFLEVEAGLKGHLDIPTGPYDYAVSICGLYTTGSMEITTYKLLDVPLCGAKYKKADSSEEVHVFELENAQEVRPVRLTILNDNYEVATVRLFGPLPYVLVVQPYSTQSFSILRGVYTWSMFACGKGVVIPDADFTHPTNTYIPTCGAKGWKVSQVPDDFRRMSGEYKEVSVKLVNKSDRPTPIRLTGPSIQAFYLFPGQTLSVVIPFGKYNLEHWACDPNAGTLTEFQAKAKATYTIQCKP